MDEKIKRLEEIDFSLMTLEDEKSDIIKDLVATPIYKFTVNRDRIHRTVCRYYTTRELAEAAVSLLKPFDEKHYISVIELASERDIEQDITFGRSTKFDDMTPFQSRNCILLFRKKEDGSFHHVPARTVVIGKEVDAEDIMLSIMCIPSVKYHAILDRNYMFCPPLAGFEQTSRERAIKQIEAYLK